MTTGEFFLSLAMLARHYKDGRAVARVLVGKHANECGLKGRRITEVRGYEMLGRDDIRYIDFLCEDT